jgi:hypothetical protein
MQFFSLSPFLPYLLSQPPSTFISCTPFHCHPATSLYLHFLHALSLPPRHLPLNRSSGERCLLLMLVRYTPTHYGAVVLRLIPRFLIEARTTVAVPAAPAALCRLVAFAQVVGRLAVCARLRRTGRADPGGGATRR